jgi:4-deoxy-L-threo-5-hexosulose-uronate ketol-isomerase
MGTRDLRKNFLVEDIFRAEHCSMTYSHVDRITFGGIMPVEQTLSLAPELGQGLGVDFFLQRRELGLINLAGAGVIKVDGTEYEVGPREALYIGQGARDLSFGSVDPAQPAKFYYNSAPAHTAYPTRKITLDAVVPGGYPGALLYRLEKRRTGNHPADGQRMGA